MLLGLWGRVFDKLAKAIMSLPTTKVGKQCCCI